MLAAGARERASLTSCEVRTRHQAGSELWGGLAVIRAAHLPERACRTAKGRASSKCTEEHPGRCEAPSSASSRTGRHLCCLTQIPGPSVFLLEDFRDSLAVPWLRLRLQCRGCGFRSGELGPHCLQPKETKNIKQSNIVTNSMKTFKKSPHQQQKILEKKKKHALPRSVANRC